MRKGSTAGIAFIILLLILLGAASYFLYLNLTAETIPLKTIFPQQQELEVIAPSQSEQFYKNMRFRDSTITYQIESSCGSRASEATQAFSEIQDKTILKFVETNNNPEISILCSEVPSEDQFEEEGYFIAGEGGPTEVINTSLYAVIFKGKASLLREEKCDTPKIATHEILHILGFDHNSNPNSILYPTLDCQQEIDQNIINDINNLYSQKSLSDLKIISVDAQKTGKYLSFEVEVINQGLKDVPNAELSLYDDSGRVEFEEGDSLSLGSIKIGTKKILTVTNVQISRSTNSIRFIVDDQNTVEEIFETNNVLNLVLESNS